MTINQLLEKENKSVHGILESLLVKCSKYNQYDDRVNDYM